jgi:hypothetical protein
MARIAKLLVLYVLVAAAWGLALSSAMTLLATTTPPRTTPGLGSGAGAEQAAVPGSLAE